MTDEQLRQANDLQIQRAYVVHLFEELVRSMNTAAMFDDQYRQKILAAMTEIRNDIDRRFHEL